MGAATPNPRTCHLLTHRDGLLILSFIPSRRAPGSATRRPAAGIPPNGLGNISSSASWVSAIGFSISRKGNFRAREKRKWQAQLNVVSAETDANEESDVVGWSDSNRLP